MRTRALIDLIAQSIIIIPVVLTFLFYAAIGEAESVSILAALGALFLGPWQLIGSAITTIKRRPFYQLRRMHLIGSATYFVVCGLGIWLLMDIDDSLDVFLVTFGYGLPIALAFLYYYITYKTFLLTR